MWQAGWGSVTHFTKGTTRTLAVTGPRVFSSTEAVEMEPGTLLTLGKSSTAELHPQLPGLLFRDRILLNCPGCPQTHSVAQAALELGVLLPEPPKQLGWQVGAKRPSFTGL